MYQMYRIHMEELQIHKNDAEYCEKQALIKDISYMECIRTLTYENP